MGWGRGAWWEGEWVGMGVLGAEGRCAGRWGWACGAGAGGSAGAGAAGPCVIPRVGRGGWRQPGTQGSSFYPWSRGYEGDTGAAEGRSEDVPPLANFVTPWRWQSGSSLKNTIQKFLCKGTTSGSQGLGKRCLGFPVLAVLVLTKALKVSAWTRWNLTKLCPSSPDFRECLRAGLLQFYRPSWAEQAQPTGQRPQPPHTHRYTGPQVPSHRHAPCTH